MSKEPTQQAHWDAKHARGEHEQYGYTPSDFAQSIVSTINEEAKVLELGCGVGHDSKFLAKHADELTAIDFSSEVIEQNRDKYHGIKNLEFMQMDMTNIPWDFSDESFDVVYSHLALHYFTKMNTRKIFQEIHRTLKPSGRLLFVCKSIKDRYYGKGKELEEDMFLYKGHIRHLYSQEFVRFLTDELFEINKLEYATNDFFGKKSEFIRCTAIKM